MTPRMTTEQAILHLRADTSSSTLVRDAYLDADPQAACDRFAASAEFAETLRIVRAAGCLGHVVDLGAGTGIASWSFASAGASVVALEPDLSEVVGIGRLAVTAGELPIGKVAGVGGAIPLVEGSVDLVYCRQVLHHILDLDATLRECARVLRPGGLFLAVREHVVDDDEQLATFLSEHPVHRLAGGENAWSLPTYRRAIVGAGLVLDEELGPWDSILNAFPEVRQASDLPRAPQIVMGERYGRLGALAGALPGVRALVWRRLRRGRPGRLYTFVAHKPSSPVGVSRPGSR